MIRESMLGGLLLANLFAQNVFAQPSGKTGRAQPQPSVTKLDASQAAALWHSLLQRAVPEAEMLAMFDARLEDHDEFARRKVVKKARSALHRKEALAKHGGRFSLSLRRPLGEYDFQSKGFPVDVPAGRIGLPVGRYRYESGTCGGFTTDTAIYQAWIESPAEISFVPMGEAAAERLMPRLRRERVVEVQFILEPLSAKEQRAAMSDEGAGLSCGLIRELHCAVREVRVSLPALEAGFGGPAAPRRLLKSWKL